MITSDWIHNNTTYYGTVFRMNSLFILRKQIIAETLRVLTEIKLEQMGFPQEIVARIRAIPAASVSEKLKPIEFERYIAWVGSVLKSDRAGSLYLVYPMREAYNQVNSLVSAKLANTLIKTDPDSLENFDKIDQENYRQVIKDLVQAVNPDNRTSLPKLLKFAKQLNGFFTGYLPKRGVKVPESFLEQINSISQKLIDAYFEEFAGRNSFAIADSMVSNKFAYFTSFLEKMNLDDYDSIAYFEVGLEQASGNIEDEENVLQIKGMPKGFYWYNLNVSQCKIEAKRMGHCGTDSRGDLYSLRSKSPNAAFSESHVTISYNESESTVYQVKGSGNSAPISKYWPMIAAFFNALNVQKSEESGQYSDEDFEPLNEYLRQNTNASINSPFDDLIKDVESDLQSLKYYMKDRNLPADMSTVLFSKRHDSDNYSVIATVNYHFVVPSEAITSETSFQRMSNDVADFTNEFIEQLLRNESYEAYQNTIVETNLSVVSEKNNKQTIEIQTTATLDLEDSGRDYGDLKELFKDYKVAIRDLFITSTIEEYAEECKKAIEMLYEKEHLIQPAGFGESLAQLKEKLIKNPHVSLSPKSTGAKINIIQTSNNLYSFMYDFDEYFDAIPAMKEGVKNSYSITRGLTAYFKNNAIKIVLDFLKASESLIADQLDFFRSGKEQINMETVADTMVIDVYGKGEENFKIDLAFQVSNTSSLNDVASVVAAVEFLTENYSYFLEYLDKLADQKLEDALRYMEKMAIKNPKGDVPSSNEIAMILARRTN